MEQLQDNTLNPQAFQISKSKNAADARIGHDVLSKPSHHSPGVGQKCKHRRWCGIIVIRRQSPWPILKEISWGILPLVAGLFVLVEALAHTGVIATINQVLSEALARAPAGAT
jgi:hypothetical protein